MDNTLKNIEKPKFSISGPILITTNKPTLITVTISNIDKNRFEYYYTTKASPEISSSGIGAIWKMPSNFQIYMEKEKPFLFICSKDIASSGLISDWSVVEVPINTAPFCKISYNIANEISSINQEKIYINQLRNISASFYSESEFLTKFTRRISSYKWKIGSVNNYEERTSLAINEIEIPPINFKNNESRNIIISLEIKDEYGDIFSFSETLNYYRIKLQSPKSIAVFPQKEQSIISPQYLGNNIKFKVGCSQPEDEPQFSLIFYKGQKENDKWKYEAKQLGKYLLKDGDSFYENCISNMQDDIVYKFKVDLVISQSSEDIVLGSLEDDEVYELLKQLELTTFDFSKKEWHPIKSYVDNVIFGSKAEDEIVKFTSTYFNDFENTGLFYYKIEALFEGKIIELANKISPNLPLEKWKVKTDGDTITFEIKNLALFKKLNVSSNTNSFQIQYRITCYNGFDRPGSPIIFTGTVITKEPPSIEGYDLNFKVNSDMTLAPAENFQQYNNWINPGDKITFLLDRPPFDYNDYLLINPNSEDRRFFPTVVKYEIGYRYNQTENWKSLQISDFDYSSYFTTSNLIDSEQNPLKEKEDLYLLIPSLSDNFPLELETISLPDLTDNIINGKEVEFGLRFIDDGNLYSEYLTKTFFACRKTNPIFNINDAKSNSIIDEDGSSFKEIAVYLKSIDLGGNSEGAENFQRSGKEEYTVIFNFDSENSDNLSYTIQLDSKNNSDLILSEETGYFSTQRSFVLKEDWNRIYIKATIRIITNSETGDFIETTTSTYLLYLNEPTLSHRSHWIGINNTANGLKDVFQVSSFEDRKNIKLTGFYRENDETKDIWINIDLDKGKILSSENIEIDLFTGILTKITGDSNTMKVDLNNGNIINANIENADLTNTIISGGSW